MTILYKNNAYSTLAGTLAAGATSMSVQTGHGDRFPQVTAPDVAYITLENAGGTREIVKITARSAASDTMTIVRAQEGTTDSSWAIGDTVEQRVTAGELAAFATQTGTETLTNKRVTPRVGSTTSSATPTINTDLYDVYKLTAQTVDITSFTTNLSGTPTEDQPLIIKITGTAARAITWGASFEAGTFALPTTTVTTAMLTVGFMWNSVTSKWRCMGAV